jgi:hypothetical protein
MTADPRTYGVGTGDLVDVVVRGRVVRTGPLSITLDVPTVNVVFPYVAGAPVEVWIPAEGIRSAVLAVPDPAPADRCASCGQSRDEHRLALHAFTDDRGGSGIGVVLCAVAIAVLAVLGFLSVAQEFERAACGDVAGTPAACESTP